MRCSSRAVFEIVGDETRKCLNLIDLYDWGLHWNAAAMEQNG